MYDTYEEIMSCGRFAFFIPPGVLSSDFREYRPLKPEDNIGTIAVPENIKYFSPECDISRYSPKRVVIAGTPGFAPGAFSGCSELRQVLFGCMPDPGKNIPDTSQIIPDFLFEDCTSLEEVVLPSWINEIGELAFSGCRSLRHINLPRGVKYIGKGAFESSGLEHISIPDGTEEVEAMTFSDCRLLSSVKLPSTLKYIGQEAFRACSSLRELDLPSSCRKIDAYAFMRSGIESITIHNYVDIDSLAFSQSHKYNI